MKNPYRQGVCSIYWWHIRRKKIVRDCGFVQLDHSAYMYSNNLTATIIVCFEAWNLMLVMFRYLFIYYENRTIVRIKNNEWLKATAELRKPGWKDGHKGFI